MKKGPPKPMVKNCEFPCPICGRPRGAGIVFVDHGKCMERMAADAAVVKKRQGHAPCSDDDLRIAKSKRAAKKASRGYTRFLSGL